MTKLTFALPKTIANEAYKNFKVSFLTSMIKMISHLLTLKLVNETTKEKIVKCGQCLLN